MDNTNHITDSEYLGITEAADYLRVSASTLRRWEKKGFLVPERTPTGIRRYTKKQLDDVIQTPAYEKPTVAYQAPPVAPLEDREYIPVETQNTLVPEEEPTSVDEYVHVVDPQPSDAIAQHTIDSQIESRPSSFTSVDIDHGYAPLEYGNNPQKEEKINFDPVMTTKDTEQPSLTAPYYDHPKKPEERIFPSTMATDNFATVGQQQFNHIFDIKDPDDVEEQVELEEYDSDAAYVQSEPRASSYVNNPNVTEKVAKGRFKPVFLFLSVFLAIVIISLVAWFALNSTSVSGAPLNPVIE